MVHFLTPDGRGSVRPLLHFSPPSFFIDGLLGLDIESLSVPSAEPGVMQRGSISVILMVLPSFNALSGAKGDRTPLPAFPEVADGDLSVPSNGSGRWNCNLT